MSKHWEKEDRHCWQKSEVMQNFEKTILENYATLEAHSKIITAQKMTVPQVKEMKTTLDGAAASAKELNKQLSGTSAADDGEVSDNTEDCVACHSADDVCAVHDQSCEFHEPINNEEYSDDEVKLAKTSLLAELRKMASDAIAVRDMALVYRVERTIQELLEPEDND